MVTFAALIDLSEIIIEFAMTALGATAGGAAGGCAVGAYYGGQVGCAVGAALGGFLGFLAQTTGAGEVMGFLLGYLLSVCIALSFGVMLATALFLTDNLEFFPTMYVFVGKLVPLLGLAPGWSWYAWRCTKPQRAAATSISGVSASTDGSSQKSYAQIA